MYLKRFGNVEGGGVISILLNRIIMKAFSVITLLLLSLSFFSCNRSTAIEKNWSDPQVKDQLKREIKKDPVFLEYISLEKLIQIKLFLKRGTDFTIYDSSAFLNATIAGKTLQESITMAGAKADDEYINAVNNRKYLLESVIKKYPGLRYFNVSDWKSLTAEEFNKNFQENIAPYLKDVYRSRN